MAGQPWRYESIRERRRRDAMRFRQFTAQRQAQARIPQTQPVEEESSGGGGFLGGLAGVLEKAGSTARDIGGAVHDQTIGRLPNQFQGLAELPVAAPMDLGRMLTGDDPRDVARDRLSRTGRGLMTLMSGRDTQEALGIDTSYLDTLRNRGRLGQIGAAAIDTVTSPATLATVGTGGAIAQGLRAGGRLGRLGAGLIEPVARGGFGSRLAAETALGTGAMMGSQLASEHTDNPLLQLGAGLVGGAVGMNAPRAYMRTLGPDGVAVRGLAAVQGRPGREPMLGMGIEKVMDSPVRKPEDFGKLVDTPIGDIAEEASEGGVYARGLRPLREVISEVDTVANAAVRRLLSLPGPNWINPSLLENTDAGKAMVGYQRQRVAAEQLAEAAIEAALDRHNPRGGLQVAAGRGGRLFDISDDATILNLPEGQSRTWQDVFSKPDNYELSEAQRAYVDDFHQVINDMELLRAEAGLPAFPREPDGTLYVPRTVKNIRGVEITRPSNRRLTRLYEEAAEGVANGVRYDNDPRNTLKLYTSSTYREIVEQQLSEVLEPLSVKPSELISPKIVERRKKAIVARQEAERAVRAERAAVIKSRNQSAREIARVRKLLATAEKRVAAIRAELKGRSDIVERAGGRADTLRGQAETLRSERLRSPEGFPEARIEMPPSEGDIARAAGREQTASEINRAVGRTSPMSYGERMREAVNRVEELKAELDTLTSAAKTLPRVHSRTGKPLSTKAAKRLEAARLEHEKARTAYSKAMAAARSASVADERIFHPLRIRLRDAEAEVQAKISAARKAKGAARDIAEAEVADARAKLEEAKTAYAEAKKNVDGPLFGNTRKDISIKQWRNRFYRAEDHERIVKVLDPANTDPNIFLRPVEAAANLTRTAASVGDFAMPFHQGLPLLGRDPLVWARMTAKHYQAFFDPTTQSQYIGRNLSTINEMAQYGVPISSDEFYTGMENLSRIGTRLGRKSAAAESAIGGIRTVGRQTVGRFQSSYQTGLTVARAELWKALSPSWKGTKNELAAHIRNMTGGLDTRALGASPNQRAVESMWLAFSPRLLRSTIGLVAEAARPGTAQGQEAIRTLAQLAAGAAGVYALTGVALGKDWDEIQEGLNPLNAKSKKFLSHEVNGDWIGVGGQIRALTQFTAKMITSPDQMFTTTDQFDNPLIAFFMSRGAPMVNIALGAGEAISGGKWDAMKYEDIDNPVDLGKHIFKSGIPFALQGVLEGQSALATATSMVGARTSPGTPTDRLNTIAQRLFEKDFYDLERSQQESIKAQNPDLWREAIEKGSKERRQAEARREELRIEQEADDVKFQSGEITMQQWRQGLDERGVKLREAQRLIYGESDRESETPLDHYYDAIEMATDEAGRTNWDAVYEWLAELPNADRLYIERNKSVGGLTDMVKAYRDTASLRDEYYSLPMYRGYSGDEGRQIDDLWARARASIGATGTVPEAKMLRALRQVAQEMGVDRKILSGARRRVLGMLKRTNDRQRFLKKHPEVALFVGSGYASPDDLSTLGAALL